MSKTTAQQFQWIEVAPGVTKPFPLSMSDTAIEDSIKRMGITVVANPRADTTGAGVKAALTAAHPEKSMGRRMLESGVEAGPMIGATVGGLVGTAAGPGGTLAGGTLGAVGGEYLRQRAEQALGMNQAPQNLTQETARLAGAGAGTAAGTAAAEIAGPPIEEATSKVLGRLAGILLNRSKLGKGAAAAKWLAEKLGRGGVQAVEQAAAPEVQAPLGNALPKSFFTPSQPAESEVARTMRATRAALPAEGSAAPRVAAPAPASPPPAPAAMPSGRIPGGVENQQPMPGPRPIRPLPAWAQFPKVTESAAPAALEPPPAMPSGRVPGGVENQQPMPAPAVEPGPSPAVSGAKATSTGSRLRRYAKDTEAARGMAQADEPGSVAWRQKQMKTAQTERTVKGRPAPARTPAPRTPEHDMADQIQQSIELTQKMKAAGWTAQQMQQGRALAARGYDPFTMKPFAGGK